MQFWEYAIIRPDLEKTFYIYGGFMSSITPYKGPQITYTNGIQFEGVEKNNSSKTIKGHIQIKTSHGSKEYEVVLDKKILKEYGNNAEKALEDVLTNIGPLLGKTLTKTTKVELKTGFFSNKIVGVKVTDTTKPTKIFGIKFSSGKSATISVENLQKRVGLAEQEKEKTTGTSKNEKTGLDTLRKYQFDARKQVKVLRDVIANEKEEADKRTSSSSEGIERENLENTKREYILDEEDRMLLEKELEEAAKITTYVDEWDDFEREVFPEGVGQALLELSRCNRLISSEAVKNREGNNPEVENATRLAKEMEASLRRKNVPQEKWKKLGVLLQHWNLQNSKRASNAEILTVAKALVSQGFKKQDLLNLLPEGEQKARALKLLFEEPPA